MGKRARLPLRPTPDWNKFVSPTARPFYNKDFNPKTNDPLPLQRRNHGNRNEKTLPLLRSLGFRMFSGTSPVGRLERSGDIGGERARTTGTGFYRLSAIRVGQSSDGSGTGRFGAAGAGDQLFDDQLSNEHFHHVQLFRAGYGGGKDPNSGLYCGHGQRTDECAGAGTECRTIFFGPRPTSAKSRISVFCRYEYPASCSRKLDQRSGPSRGCNGTQKSLRRGSV